MPEPCHCGEPGCNLGAPASIRDGFLTWEEFEELQELFAPPILRMVLTRWRAMKAAREGGRIGVAADTRGGRVEGYVPTIPAPFIPVGPLTPRQ